MKGGPKLSLRLFLHQALQFLTFYSQPVCQHVSSSTLSTKNRLFAFD